METGPDNVGLFFGEGRSGAFGVIVLIHSLLRGSGVDVEPLHIVV